MTSPPQSNHVYVHSPPPPLAADMPNFLPDATTLPSVQYTVQLSTADSKWAGTTKPVYIVLFGDLHHTDFIHLREDHHAGVQTSLRYVAPDNFNTATSSADFPQGSVREFRFTAAPVGNLIKICIRHDPANDSTAAWKLDRVVVRNEDLQRSWTFLASRWLSFNNGNQIELKPLGEVAAGRRASRRASRRLSITKQSRLSHAPEGSSGADRFASMRDRFGNDDVHGADQVISKGSEAGTRRVCFQLQKFTNPCCHVYLLGAIPALGGWNAERAIRMNMHSAADGTWRGEWRLELEIDDDYDDIQYQYIIVNEKDSNKKRRVEYPDRMRRFKLSAPDSLGRSTEGGRVHIRDSFNANKFGLPSASTPSLVLRKSYSRHESMDTPRIELAQLSTAATTDRAVETPSSPSTDRLRGSLNNALDNASEGPEEQEEQDPVADNASEEPNGQFECDFGPGGQSSMGEKADEGQCSNKILPRGAISDSVTGASIMDVEKSSSLLVPLGEEIQQKEEAVRREWKEQLVACDGQLFESAKSLVIRQPEILYLKKRNSEDVADSPVLIPQSPDSPERISPVSSDGALNAEPFHDQGGDEVTSTSCREAERPLIGERDRLRAEVERLEKERDQKYGLYLEVSAAHDSLRADLKQMSEQTSARCEEYETHHAELVRLVMDGEEAYRCAREELEAERNSLHERWAQEFKARRRLFNKVQELRGNIRVFCRVRPLKAHALSDGLEVKSVAEFPDAPVGENSRITIRSKCFEFDHVFQPSASQIKIYEETSGVMASVLDGYNVCVFAYGQTGSGKTYTMNGPDHDRGVNYRALVDLFDVTAQRKDFQRIEISVSMMEIYNENLRDLIREDDDSAAPKLDIRKDPNSSSSNAVYVPNLTEISVTSVEHVWEVMERGFTNRSQGRTNMNEHSSRSHLIFKVTVTCEDFSSSVKTTGMLHLVDLAGSERVGRSNVSGDRLKEAQHINKSLATLGDVFMALLSNSAHVPYRNSRLTYLLQDCIGGDSKTLMFVNVSADEVDSSETLSSLQFAQRVAKVELGSARKHAERTSETKAVVALQAKEDDLHEANSMVASLRRELRKQEELVEESARRARALEGELKSLKSQLEEQNLKKNAERQGSAQALKELRAMHERGQSDLKGAKQKAKDIAQSKDEEIAKLQALLKSRDKKIAGLSRVNTRTIERSSEQVASRMSRPASTPSVGVKRSERTPLSKLPRNATFAGRTRQVRFDESHMTEREEDKDEKEGKSNSIDDSAFLPPPTPMNAARRTADGKLVRSQTMQPPRPQRQASRLNSVTGASKPTYAFGRRVDANAQEGSLNKPARNVRLPRAPTSLRPAQRVAQLGNRKESAASFSSFGRPSSAARRTGTITGTPQTKDRDMSK